MKLFGAALIGLGGICIAVTANAADNKNKVVKPQPGIFMKAAQSKKILSKKEKVEILKQLIQIDSQSKNTNINVPR